MRERLDGHFVRIHRAALWILGEYCVSLPDIRYVMDEVKKSLGEVESDEL